MKWHDELGNQIEWCWVAPFDDMLIEGLELFINEGLFTVD
jgi:hypothetical protein